MAEQSFRSGFVSIIGRPNVGKSTLLNRIVGENIAITSEKPQTTRNRIQGIMNFTGGQAVFIDTPGIHKAKSLLNRFMVESALAVLNEVDIVMFLVEATDDPDRQETFLLELLRGVEVPVYLVINKMDKVAIGDLLKRIEGYKGFFPFKEIIPVSALHGDGVDYLMDRVTSGLPEGPPYFPDDILTDVPERFIAAEIVREKIFRLMHEEIPYSVAVEIDSFKEGENLISIYATINVEKDSQKGMIIGKRGDMLKKIGTQARQDLERLLQSKIYLELFVRVRRDWSEDKRQLKELGYQ